MGRVFSEQPSHRDVSRRRSAQDNGRSDSASRLRVIPFSLGLANFLRHSAHLLRSVTRATAWCANTSQQVFCHGVRCGRDLDHTCDRIIDGPLANQIQEVLSFDFALACGCCCPSLRRGRSACDVRLFRAHGLSRGQQVARCQRPRCERTTAAANERALIARRVRLGRQVTRPVGAHRAASGSGPAGQLEKTDAAGQRDQPHHDDAPRRHAQHAPPPGQR
jgi:hypothetical protein